MADYKLSFDSSSIRRLSRVPELAPKTRNTVLTESIVFHPLPISIHISLG